jgi:outer membrane protein assembly factor BamB
MMVASPSGSTFATAPMTRSRGSLIYVGIKHSVIAFDRKTGVEVWSTALPAKYRSTASIVNVVRDTEGLFATCSGEVFALDPKTGALLWHDPLKGFGTGLATLVTDFGGGSQSAPALAQEMLTRAAATAGSSAV